jgi:Bacterial Ig domain
VDNESRAASRSVGLFRAALVLIVLLAVPGVAGASGAGKGGGKGRARDTTAPVLRIASPLPAALVSGLLSVQGSASDNAQVAKVELSVDGGVFRSVQGTTSWTYPVDTRALSDGSHMLTARAIDTSGNQALASVAVAVANTASDSTPPLIAVAAPAAGAQLSGVVTVSGSARDDSEVTRVEVGVDGVGYQLASGTTSWSLALDLTGHAEGTHEITARATDGPGNVAVARVSVSVMSSTPDTTPPVVSVGAPAAQATVSGAVVVSGSASDDIELAKVEVGLDGAAFRLAQGTSAWSLTVDTTSLAQGSHTVSARATDHAGNVATVGVPIMVGSSSLPPGVSDQLVTPEGATVQISSTVTGWTAQQVYNLLRPNASDLGLVGPHLTVKVQTQYASSTSTSAGTSGGVYATFRATIYLNASPGTVFATRPDSVLAHEYGHAWTMYHLYITNQGDWTPWLTARGLAGEARLDSSYVWSKNEMVADDYRMLFGTATAIAQAAYINPDVPDPRTVAGLRDFFLGPWRT